MNKAISENLEEVILGEIERMKLMDGWSEADKLDKAKELAILYRAKLAQESSESTAEAELIKAKAEAVKAEAEARAAEAKAEAEKIKAEAEMLEAEAEVKDKKKRRVIDVALGTAKIVAFLGYGLVTFFVGIAFEDDHYLSGKIFQETRNKVNMKLGD